MESSLIRFVRLLLPTAGIFRDRSVGANVVLSRIGIICFVIGSVLTCSLPLAVTTSFRWRLLTTSIRLDVWPVVVLVASVFLIVMERILLPTSGVLRGRPVDANVTRLHVGIICVDIGVASTRVLSVVLSPMTLTY
jgi:predicted lysophospholipase L1 biosynthesis ABC-type transport system permease subunit